jgi:hypothetical protein
MLELLVRLECKRQDLIRKRALRQIGESGTSFWGIASLIFFISLFPLLIAAPAAAAATPPEAGLVGGLTLAGFVLCATVVGAPIGLVLL